MKELQSHQPEKTEIHAVKPIKKELKHIGQIRPQKGQLVWEMNLKTREIKPAEYDEVSVGIDGGLKRKLVVKPDFIYAPAINVKNADKKFFKMLGIPYPKNAKPKIKA